MNFTMKILAVCVLLVAMVALALATEAVHAPELEAIQEVIETAFEIEELESTEGEKKCVVKRPVCSRGWTMIGKTCYRYFAKAMTWAEAQAYCKRFGADLASVHNKNENNRFWALALKKTAWIGFSDAQQEKHWFWIDGTALNYKNWCKGQPNNGRSQEHCAVLWKGQNCWHDYHCVLHRFPYICGRAPQ